MYLTYSAADWHPDPDEHGMECDQDSHSTVLFCNPVHCFFHLDRHQQYDFRPLPLRSSPQFLLVERGKRLRLLLSATAQVDAAISAFTARASGIISTVGNIRSAIEAGSTAQLRILARLASQAFLGADIIGNIVSAFSRRSER